MSNDFLSIEIIGERKLLRDLEDMPDVVRTILREKLKGWLEETKFEVETNILSRFKSNEDKEYSGSDRHLADSVEVEFVDDGVRFEGHVYIRGIPYASIQEKGGYTRPHVIEP